MLRNFLLSLFCSCIIFSSQLSAQSIVADSAIRKDAYNKAVSNYFLSMGENSMLNHGNEVLEYTIPSQMHQYFLSDQFLPGEVVANGTRYPDASLLYDIVHDKLIVKHYSNILKVEQISEKVESFTMQGHEFERIIADSVSQETITTGFYEVLHKGKPLAVYARRTKSPEEQIKDMQVILIFNEKNRLFVKKDNTWYAVSDRKDALKVMSDKKKEMEDFLKKNKIKFRKQPEAALSQMAAYYDSLKR